LAKLIQQPNPVGTPPDIPQPVILRIEQDVGLAARLTDFVGQCLDFLHGDLLHGQIRDGGLIGQIPTKLF